MTRIPRAQDLGVSVQYLADDHHAARSFELARNGLLRLHHQDGYLWILSRIRTETKEIDPYFSREDQIWLETTYTFTVHTPERILAPLVKRARWAASLQLARWAYDLRLHDKAKADPHGPAGKFHDLVVRTRRRPNILDDAELYQRLGVPVYEYVRGETR